MQVTQKVPMLANHILKGIPTTLDVKGLELNISLAGTVQPCLTYLRPASMLNLTSDYTHGFSALQQCELRAV